MPPETRLCMIRNEASLTVNCNSSSEGRSFKLSLRRLTIWSEKQKMNLRVKKLKLRKTSTSGNLMLALSTETSRIGLSTWRSRPKELSVMFSALLI